MRAHLVFDIGLHHGNDSAYYLHLGYRVIGVEANPLLAKSCCARFEREIGEGRMKVINTGVLSTPGEFTFHRNLRNDEWSSFISENVKREGPWEQIQVPCITTAKLIADHGKPFFIKIDIEGADIQALASLTPETAPPYISLEFSTTDPILETLIGLGYSAFKLVDGDSFFASPPIFDYEIGWRFLRKAGRKLPFLRRAISSLPQPLRWKSEYDPPGMYSPDGYPFQECSSGPFGENAFGPWLTASATFQQLEKLRALYRRASQENMMWWDIHARRSSPSSF
jgi:FkbM family methyltransferase